MMRFFVLAGALALAGSTFSSAALAQSVPNVSGVKQTTQRAVNRTNAHTLAMTNVDSAKVASSTTAPRATSGKTVETPATDTAPGRGRRATAAGAATATRASSPADTAG